MLLKKAGGLAQGYVTEIFSRLEVVFTLRSTNKCALLCEALWTLNANDTLETSNHFTHVKLAVCTKGLSQ